MEERLPLAEGRGSLTLRVEGPRVVLEAVLENDNQGLYKAYLTGMGGRLLLGTLMPENGMLKLRRTISIDELRRKGVWPLRGAGVELAFPVGQDCPAGWVREPKPSRLMGERLLAQSAEQVQRVLLRREPGGFSLAVPWVADRAFPFPPIFCFARLERLDHSIYVIFSFNAQGYPVFGDKAVYPGTD